MDLCDAVVVATLLIKIVELVLRWLELRRKK